MLPSFISSVLQYSLSTTFPSTVFVAPILPTCSEHGRHLYFVILSDPNNPVTFYYIAINMPDGLSAFLKVCHSMLLNENIKQGRPWIQNEIPASLLRCQQ